MSSTRSSRLFNDEPSLVWAAEDWGHIIHHRPRGVLRPETAEDLVGTHSLPLVPRGQGHSISGQAQTLDGVVVDMSGLDSIHDITADRVVVDSGARWSQILSATLRHGLTPPVLTDYLELSVGGTLSVGGIGGASQRYGLQTDNVLELDVVTPDGQLRTCSPSHNPELFDDVRAGHGRYGIIVRAALRLIPAHSRTRRKQLHYSDLATFLADQRRLVADGRFHYLEGQAKLDESGRWSYVIEAATFHSSTSLDTGRLLDDLDFTSVEVEEFDYFDFLNRMALQENELKSRGDWYWPHPWINVFLPATAAERVMTDTMRTHGTEDIGETGVVLIYPFHTGKVRTRRIPLPQEPVSFLFALLRTAPPNDPATVRRMLEHNQQLRQHTLTAGGTVYL